MRIYLAGPITGKGYDEVMELFSSKIVPLEEMGFKVFHPMLGKDFLRNETEFQAHGLKHPVITNHAIFERDKWMVEHVDMVLADLSTATHPSIGTMFELAWACLKGKYVIVVMGEENIHQHAFVIEAADVVLPTVDDALAYLSELII